jgi:protein involved in polysaccharide export with SLBB domain
VTVQRASGIFVQGAVNKPSLLNINDTQHWTVLTALAAAGNVTRYGILAQAVIVRRHADGTSETIPVRVAQILRKKAPDVALEDGDVLLIPEGPHYKIPGGYPLDTPALPPSVPARPAVPALIS